MMAADDSVILKGSALASELRKSLSLGRASTTGALSARSSTTKKFRTSIDLDTLLAPKIHNVNDGRKFVRGFQQRFPPQTKRPRHCWRGLKRRC